MEEIWKDIIVEKNGITYNYTGKYQVSNFGRVRNIKTNRILKSTINKNGYITVALCKNGKQEWFKVHRLVATMFIPNPDNFAMVNHKDEIKHNNCVDNLEWCDAKYNTNYGTAIERRAIKITGQNNPMYNIGENHWNYGRTTSQKTRQKISDNHADVSGGKNPRAIKVICIETGEIFNTLKEAAFSKKCSADGISKCCKGKKETCGNYHWKIIEKESDRS